MVSDFLAQQTASSSQDTSKPKGIGDLNVLPSSVSFISGVTRHLKAERHWRRCPLGAGTVSVPDWSQDTSKPKGIGDARLHLGTLNHFLSHKTPQSRKALETAAVNKWLESVEQNVTRHLKAERHWRLRRLADGCVDEVRVTRHLKAERHWRPRHHRVHPVG